MNLREEILNVVVRDHVLMQAATMVAATQVVKKITEKAKKPRKRRTVWVRPMLRVREVHGHYDQHMLEMVQQDDHQGFQQFMRLNFELFQEVLNRVRDRIQRRDTTFRRAMPASVKLALTLRYLATGDCYPTVVAGFRVSKSMISRCVPEVCDAIYEEYEPEVMRCPNTVEEW